MYHNRIVLGILLLTCASMLMIPYTAAWTGYTHEWICMHAGLEELDCANADIPAVQKNYSGLGFVNHHCADNTVDCAARKTARKFHIMNSTNKTITDGFAAHLYADAHVPVHWHSFDYYSCHKIFEDRVEKELKNAGNTKYVLFTHVIDTSAWEFSMQCVDKQGNTYTLYSSREYMDNVAANLAQQMNTTTKKDLVKTVNITGIIMTGILIIIILCIGVLMIYWLKRR